MSEREREREREAEREGGRGLTRNNENKSGRNRENWEFSRMKMQDGHCVTVCSTSHEQTGAWGMQAVAMLLQDANINLPIWRNKKKKRKQKKQHEAMGWIHSAAQRPAAAGAHCHDTQ